MFKLLLQPSNGNRILDSNSQRNDNRFQDLDGSITSHPKSWLVRSIPFYLTSNCEERENWNMAVCDEVFGQVSG